MECSENFKVTKEEVIAWLKDDGDFDRLRRKIIQKLKNNEELRENIISIARQSEALNRPGAENMKPRQLSDDIYQEVGEKVMSQISDGLWGIIRSSDNGTRSEITKTVQSVYNKLANPREYAEVGSSAADVAQVRVESNNNGVVVVSANGSVGGVVVDNDPNASPGFSLSHNNEETNNHEPSPSGKGAMTEQQEGTHQLQDKMDAEAVNHVVAQGFSGHRDFLQTRSTSRNVMAVMRTLMCLLGLVNVVLKQCSLALLLFSHTVRRKIYIGELTRKLVSIFLQWESFYSITFVENEMINTTDILFDEGIWICLCCAVKVVSFLKLDA